MWGAPRISIAARRALTIPPRTPSSSKNQQNRERELPDPVLKIRAEWIRAGKFAPNPRAGAWLFLRDDRACPSHPGLFIAARRQDVDTPRSVYAKASPGSPASPPKL